MTIDLRHWGWRQEWEEACRPVRAGGWRVGRVVLEKRGFYRLVSEQGEVAAGTTGRVRHVSGGAAELPAVGDWVLFEPAEPGQERALIQSVLPRRSQLSRKVAGPRSVEQVVAANLDTVFVVMGLDGDFNLRRLERFLVVAMASHARAVIVLNKADLAADLPAGLAEVEAVASGAEIVVTSCRDGRGLEDLRAHLRAAETAVLLGSSGVGKSTLVNALAEEERAATGEVRSSDDRGKHTTTHRQLFLLPGGALLLDNPGVREIQAWQAGEGLRRVFEEVHELARGCRFRDCRHDSEPGCAVREAAEKGELDPSRLESYLVLLSEQADLERRRARSKRSKKPPGNRFSSEPGHSTL